MVVHVCAVLVSWVGMVWQVCVVLVSWDNCVAGVCGVGILGQLCGRCLWHWYFG